jgi:hypothetical protein
MEYVQPNASVYLTPLNPTSLLALTPVRGLRIWARLIERRRPPRPTTPTKKLKVAC